MRLNCKFVMICFLQTMFIVVSLPIIKIMIYESMRLLRICMFSKSDIFCEFVLYFFSGRKLSERSKTRGNSFIEDKNREF